MPISEKLNNLSLISGNKVSEIFDALYSDILDLDYKRPSEFIRMLWDRYENTGQSTNGNVFEGLLATLFYREGIAPLFVQAKLTFIPNIDFDFIAYSKEVGPIVISAKTSLRERYKQADLEGMMLRQVHRRSESYLITLHEAEANSVQRKVETGDVLGLDKVIYAEDNAMDDLIIHLQAYEYILPKKIDVVTSTRLITK